MGSLPRLLVVDDEEPFRYAVARSLRAAGFEVLEAADYRQATNILISTDVALILIDIVLKSRINGLALGRIAKILRKNVRLLYMTGYNVPASRGTAGKILRKPIEDEELVREIREALAA